MYYQNINKDISSWFALNYIKYYNKERLELIKKICDELNHIEYVSKYQMKFQKPDPSIFINKKKEKNRKRIRKEPPKELRCIALVCDKTQCKLSKLKNKEYCGRHVKTRKYGTINDNSFNDRTHIFVKKYNEEYLIDTENNIYTYKCPVEKVGILENNNIKFI